MARPPESAAGMVATSHPEATRVGLEVLRTGGHAVDAAIAANAALGVIEPHMCGVGGDLMAMVWDAKAQTLTGYNGSGCSPAGLTAEEYARRGLDHIPMRHPLTWTVPGCVMGWVHLLERFGTRSLGDLLQPAIRLAERGCAVPPIIASQWLADPLEPWAEARRVLLPGGRAPRAGELFRNPDLAKTLRRLGADWADFYRGEIAGRIGAFCQVHGGVLTEQDLAEFRGGVWMSDGDALLSTRYRVAEVFALPPNTQGLCVLEMLNMLEREDLVSLGFGTAETMHRMLEAKKLAYEDRAHLIADPAHVEIPVERLISKEHARARWSHFDPSRAMSSVPASPAEQSDTTYLCAADSEGNAISLIQSVYKPWGSGAMPEGLGFCLQNRGWGFVLDPEHPNCVGPRKRPLHTIIPGFAMRDSRPWLCFGVMGGPMQPQGQVQILTNIIDFGMDAQSACETPRWRHDGSPGQDNRPIANSGEVSLEPGFTEETQEGLRAKGHRLTGRAIQFGGYQGIMFDHERGVMMGGSDPRKDGCALGVESLSG